jgi:hypothetical protein
MIPSGNLKTWIEKEWLMLREEDYSSLMRIPSKIVRSTCELFLSDPNKYNIRFLLRLGFGELSNDERVDLYRAQCKFGHIENQPINFLKKSIKYQIDNLPEGEKRNVLISKLERLQKVETPKAPETRKFTNLLLKEKYGIKLKSTGHGTWHAPLSIGDKEGVLEIDYGGFSPGFRYSVRIIDKEKKLYRNRISYERLLGILAHDWDLIRTDKLKDQLELLLSYVEVVVELLKDIEISELYV